MNKKLKKRLKDRIISAVLVFIGMFFIAGCSGTWYGEGEVVSKSYSGGYMSYCGKTCYRWIPECHRLQVLDSQGNAHTGCVNSKTWGSAALGKNITLSEETKER